MLGACAAAGVVGSAVSSAMAVPRTMPPTPGGPEAGSDLADAPAQAAETVDGNVHNAQYVVVRRRPRRRWRVWGRRRRRYW